MASESRSDKPAGGHSGSYRYVIILFAFSGAASLIYEVLWLKDLARLFGSTAEAAAMTLAVFFLGLALGGYYIGRSAKKIVSPLRGYAVLEAGIAISAIWYLVVLWLSNGFLPEIAGWAGLGSVLFLLSKIMIAVVILLPPAILMGGTFPVIAEAVVRSNTRSGKAATGLYGANVVGAAAGAFAAGFILPPLLGFQGSYIFAIVLNVVLAFAGWQLAQYITRPKKTIAAKLKSKFDRHEPVSGRLAAGIMFWSGFAILALEVIWTRMFSQVIPKDIYSFSAILVTFLISLAVGSAIAHRLQSLRFTPWQIVAMFMGLGSLLIAMTPAAFILLTDGLKGLPIAGGWLATVSGVFMLAILTVLPPTIVIGTIFPYLIKVMNSGSSAGATIGRLVAINTIGGILGSLAAGFFMLQVLGLYRSLALIAFIYAILVIVIAFKVESKQLNGKTLAAMLALLVVVAWLPGRFPELSLGPKEEMVEYWHGSSGTVSVVRADVSSGQSGSQPREDLLIRVNNNYTLGGLGAYANQQRQTHLGFWLNPEAKKVFHVGLATGITAGASLYYPVEQVDVCELMPDVITAARRHFSPYTNNLFKDQRVSIIPEDARTCMAAQNEKYDLIISDLFNPSHAGTGSLYTKETFELSKGRMADSGLFVQWLPLYQLSENDLGIIINTMNQVFPQVTIWRGNFAADKPVIALIGQNSRSQLKSKDLEKGISMIAGPQAQEAVADALVSVRPGDRYVYLSQQQKEFVQSNLPAFKRAVPYTFYMGNLTQQSEEFSKFGINTDNRPLIEYGSPKQRRHLTGLALNQWSRRHFMDNDNLKTDKYLAGLSEEQRLYVTAGYDYYEFFARLQDAYLRQDQKQLTAAQEEFKQYLLKTGLSSTDQPAR